MAHLTPMVRSGMFRLGIASIFAAMLSPLCAQAQTVNFAGRKMSIMVGFSPGGIGYDTYGRVLARHMTRHLAGAPNIVVENRPGAGSRCWPSHWSHLTNKKPLGSLASITLQGDSPAARGAGGMHNFQQQAALIARRQKSGQAGGDHHRVTHQHIGLRLPDPGP